MYLDTFSWNRDTSKYQNTPNKHCDAFNKYRDTHNKHHQDTQQTTNPASPLICAELIPSTVGRVPGIHDLLTKGHCQIKEQKNSIDSFPAIDKF